MESASRDRQDSTGSGTDVGKEDNISEGNEQQQQSSQDKQDKSKMPGQTKGSETSREVQAEVVQSKVSETASQPVQSSTVTATVVPSPEVNSQPPVTQPLPGNQTALASPGIGGLVQSQTPRPAETRQQFRHPTPGNPPLPNQSPDVQILEVKPASATAGSYTAPAHAVRHGHHGSVPHSGSYQYPTSTGSGSQIQGRYPGSQPHPTVRQNFPVSSGSRRNFGAAHSGYPPAQAMSGSQPYHGHQKQPGQFQGMPPHLGGGRHPHPTPQPHPGQPQDSQHAHYAGYSQQQQHPHRMVSPTRQQQPVPQGHQQFPTTQSHGYHGQQPPPGTNPQSYPQGYPGSGHRPAGPTPQPQNLPGYHALPSGSHPKPKLEPVCTTPGPRFQSKTERPSSTYTPQMMSGGGVGSTGSGNNQGTAAGGQSNPAHGSSPMGNTCTYPYPHSNSSSVLPADHCQTYMMDSNNTYTMMPAFRPFNNTFATVPNFDDGQQQATFGELLPWPSTAVDVGHTVHVLLRSLTKIVLVTCFFLNHC